MKMVVHPEIVCTGPILLLFLFAETGWAEAQNGTGVRVGSGGALRNSWPRPKASLLRNSLGVLLPSSHFITCTQHQRSKSLPHILAPPLKHPLHPIASPATPNAIGSTAGRGATTFSSSSPFENGNPKRGLFLLHVRRHLRQDRPPPVRRWLP
ncbi:hypothetical protein VIGAN_09030000 [Vigna angularis var. angularis]|uniref:Secreted protein n=1 Tax=Vigna angularis var. angularis TaxID=157739 RepID=A0A0S3SVQ3_PHAAN|nr:hypothetical protein VIGAN_09030000 [Vigna angularis var. angularis]